MCRAVARRAPEKDRYGFLNETECSRQAKVARAAAALKQLARSRVGRTIRVGFGLLAVYFLAVTFAASLDEAEGRVFPSPVELAVGCALVLLGLLCAAASWNALFDHRSDTLALIKGFFAAQVAKYVPGSIWQPMALVASTGRSTGLGVGRTTGTVIIHMLVQLASGATVAAGLALAADAPGPVRLAAGAGLLSLALVKRSWLVWGLTTAWRLAGRRFPADSVPGQRELAVSLLWNLGSLGATGAAFSVLWAGFVPEAVPLNVAGFSFAWVAGFVAIPFPSGIGVREWALISTLATPATSSAIIAASAALRVVTIIAELIVIVLTTALGRFRRTRRARPSGRVLRR